LFVYKKNQLKNQGLNQKSVQTGASICHLNCPSCRVLVGNKIKEKSQSVFFLLSFASLVCVAYQNSRGLKSAEFISTD